MIRNLSGRTFIDTQPDSEPGGTRCVMSWCPSTSKRKAMIIMNTAKLGDRVRVQYVGLREDGSAVGRSRGRKVLEFTVGSKQVIRGISLGVVGMAEGEQKRLTLQPKDAFGAVRTKLIKEVPRQQFPSRL